VAKEDPQILERVREAAAQKILYLPHAVRQMARPERLISVAEVRDVISFGEVIEDYPEDARGHSCLMLGAGEGGRPIHVVCSPKGDFLAIITAYVPSTEEWRDDFRTRIEL
jgi:hypothetical protein